jgi:YVTN family beta-propeller protein
VSVINATNKREVPDIRVGSGPDYIEYIHVYPFMHKIFGNIVQPKIYVTNVVDNTVSVIDTTNDKREVPDIHVGKTPTSIAVTPYFFHETNYGSKIQIVSQGKIYVANSENNTVSVINVTNDKKEPHDIRVGSFPSDIAYNSVTGMIYVANAESNSVSVIDVSSDKVAAGVTLKNHPANSGKIICDNKEYPTNIYLYVDNGTNCTVQPDKDFQFIGWVENLNQNSTIPAGDSSGNLPVNRYGTFTANFKPLPPPIPPEYWSLIITVIVTTIIGWSIPSIFGWVKTRRQLKHLKECIEQIGKLDKNAIEEKMKGYYVEGKISEDHRQFLKERISEYYDSVKDSG